MMPQEVSPYLQRTSSYCHVMLRCLHLPLKGRPGFCCGTELCSSVGHLTSCLHCSSSFRGNVSLCGMQASMQRICADCEELVPNRMQISVPFSPRLVSGTCSLFVFVQCLCGCSRLPLHVTQLTHQRLSSHCHSTSGVDRQNGS